MDKYVRKINSFPYGLLIYGFQCVNLRFSMRKPALFNTQIGGLMHKQQLAKISPPFWGAYTPFVIAE